MAADPFSGLEGEWTLGARAPGECTVAFEGRLTNRAELSDELDCDDAPEASDAELAVEAYRRWSTGSFSRLRGTFALLLWDERKRVVFAIRDPVGTFPLFRATASDGTELVAPSMKALLEDPRVSRQPDVGALLGVLAGSMPFHDETPYLAVRRIPQGHVWEIRSDGSRSYRYWDPSPTDEVHAWIDDEELVRFDELLARAVLRALAPDPVGIYLSGGLDSVTVAALASDLAPERPVALSLAFPGDINEEAVQRSVATQLGLRHVLRPLGAAVGTKGVFQAALDLADQWPAPLQNPWLAAYLRLNADAAEAGCRTILTGGGGDEWLTVSPFWAADLIRRRQIAELVRFGRGYGRSYQIANRYVLRNVLWRYGFRPLLVEMAIAVAPAAIARTRIRRRIREVPAWLLPTRDIRELLETRVGASRDTSRNGSIYAREMRTALDHPLMDLEMEEVFESGRRSGLRIVQPFWDADLLAFLYRVAPTRLSRGDRSKGLVRDYLARRFPNCGFRDQRKIVTTSFFDQTVLREGAAAAERVGRLEALPDLGLVDAPRAEADVRRIIARRDGLSAHRVWDILTLEMWARSHL